MAASFEPHMPEVDPIDAIETIFEKARLMAAGDGGLDASVKGRNVVVVTPGRLLMVKPCPPAGSMPKNQIAPVEAMLPPSPQRNIAAIAYTELPALQADIGKAIPFFGMLLAFAYIGHAVWVFEGHPSAMAAGCRQADVLLVDGGMLPYLEKEWYVPALKSMRHPEIYLHDRASFALRRLKIVAKKP